MRSSDASAHVAPRTAANAIGGGASAASASAPRCWKCGVALAANASSHA
jgi:hypothetical protein